MRPGLALLLLPVLCLPTWADGYAETEYRQKTTGIEPALRLSIHEAIRLGVRRLRARQDPRGWVAERPESVRGTGETAVAALALRHAGIPDALDGVGPAIRWLLDRRGKTCLADTYSAGLVSLLLAADETQPRFRE